MPKTPLQTVHIIAQCKTCSWSCDNYLTAKVQAKQHARDTGHIVLVEMGTWYEERP